MNTDYKIRRATAADLNEVRAFLSQNKQGSNVDINDHSIFMIAEAENGVVGAAGAELGIPNALVRSTGVLDAWRSRGLATELLCELIRTLRPEGILELFLFSTDAGDFWTKKGFRKCEIKELVTHLPDARQVQTYMNDGSIWNEVTWRRRLSDVVSHHELSDDDFEDQFQTAKLDAKLFTHEAHVRLAWIHAGKYGEVKAIENITTQLKNFVEMLGATDKYNEPLTIAAIKCVHALRLTGDHQTFRKFIQVNSQIMTNFKATIQPFMSMG